MRVFRITVLVGVLFALSGRASAALILVHDNGGPNHPVALASDPTVPAQVGDDFQINQNYSITRVSWFGVYGGGNQLPDGLDHFSLRFYPFIGPTTPSPTPVFDFGLDTVLREPTPLTVVGGNPVFSYVADFTPVDLSPGRYLLSIVNDTTGQSERWYWHTHSSVSGDMFWFRLSSPNWQGPFGTEMSFQIYAVPEIGTGAMMGVAGLVVLRRRGRR